MTILAEDIKLLKAERQTDTDDGGGQLTGSAVVDGAMNNVFPSISRLDRTYGRFSLRKLFVAVQSANQDTYYGAHTALIRAAGDPRVIVTLMSRGDAFDERSDAQDYVEAYMTQSVQAAIYLMGPQPEGSQQILAYQRLQDSVPRVGEVLYLTETSGDAEYVRVREVISTTKMMSAVINGQLQEFERREMTIKLSSPLRHRFDGEAFHPIGPQLSTSVRVYLTQANDSARYYGIQPLAESADQGDLTVKVESIYQKIVPTARQESPLIDAPALKYVEASIPAGVVTGNVNRGASNTYEVGFPVYPDLGNFITASGGPYFDNLAGTFISANSSYLITCDYASGKFVSPIINHASIDYSLKKSAQCPSRLYTGRETITSINRGLTYTVSLDPAPLKKSFSTDFRVLGNLYSVRDAGDGTLTGDGTGTINYETGSVAITLAALPDIDTDLVHSWSWGEPDDFQPQSGGIGSKPRFRVTPPVGKFFTGTGATVSWVSGGVAKSASTTAAGIFTGDATGTWSPDELIIEPTHWPDTGVNVEVDFGSSGPLKAPSESFTPDLTGNAVMFTLAEEAVPGTVRIVVPVRAMNVYGQRVTMTVVLKDDGTGGFVKLSPDGLPNLGVGSTINYASGEVSLLVQQSYSLMRRMPYIVNGSIFENALSITVSDTTEFLAGTAVQVRYTIAGAPDESDTLMLLNPPALGKVPVPYRNTLVPGAQSLLINGQDWHDDGIGGLAHDRSPATGMLISTGAINYQTGEFSVPGLVGGVSSEVQLKASVIDGGTHLLTFAHFYTPGAPVRPGSFYVRAYTEAGALVSATANLAGVIAGSGISGTINADIGLVALQFTNPVRADSVTFNCVIDVNLPLDAEILGVDPVRLPSDGRVPVFRSGNVVVVFNTDTTALPSGLMAGQVITLPRDALASAELYDLDDVPVPSDRFVINLDAGTVTMANPLNLTGLVQPLKCTHRVETMAVVSDLQINGTLSLSAPMGHNYAAGSSFVASALLIGDMQARPQYFFSQQTWTSVWSDSRIGNNTTAQYNDALYPVEVANDAAITERWLLQFTSATAFNVVGERAGVVGSGSTAADVAPVNPLTGKPYFTLRSAGFGSGWATGNAVRFNTVGANHPVWIARTIIPGPATLAEDRSQIQVRGDVA